MLLTGAPDDSNKAGSCSTTEHPQTWVSPTFGPEPRQPAYIGVRQRRTHVVLQLTHHMGPLSFLASFLSISG